MATDMFIYFGKGKTLEAKGETRDETFEKKGGIDLISWSWGMSAQGTSHHIGGSSAGKVTNQNLTFAKYLDLSSPVLMAAISFGDHFPEATVVCRKAGAGGGKALEYLTIKMEQVYISNYTVSASSGGDERPIESVSLDFAKVFVTYYAQNKDGTKGKDSKMTYDFAVNKK